MKTNNAVRTRSGQMGLLFIILTIIAGLTFGALAIEFSHMSAVRSALHSATDAAALAGAQDLWFNADNCENDARAIAAMHTADGKVVSDATPGVDVNVTVTRPQGTTPGRVQVDASMQVNHLWGPFFEHWTDTIQVSSVAGTAGRLWRFTGNWFPIAISIDQAPTDNHGNPIGLPLNQLKPGDSITLYIGSQAFKNAAWATTGDLSPSASVINSLIDQALGLDPKKDVVVPPVTVGDTILSLNNGVQGQKDLSKEPYLTEMKSEPFLVVPIFKGAPPYNQGAEVVGITGLHVTDVQSQGLPQGCTLSITGTLMNLPQVLGESGPIPTTGDPVDDAAISRLELGPIQLIE